MQAAAVLKAYLEQRRATGASHVALRPDSLERLRAYRQGRRTRAAEVRRLVEEDSEPVLAAATLMQETAAPAPAPAAPDVVLSVPGTSKAEKLAALAALAETAPEPRALGSLRDTMVFATGSPEAELMFIGEAPGAEEERQREPFVGPAGQKLTGIIKAMGLDRERVYISNICKFRPAMPDQGSANRAPTREEMRACLPFILTEIDIVRPKVIIALGKTACEGLGIEGPVSRLRGRFFEVRGIPAMVTFHPSFILREERLAGGGLEVKRQVWEDMLQVMEKCGLAISAKQRGFFQRG